MKLLVTILTISACLLAISPVYADDAGPVSEVETTVDDAVDIGSTAISNIVNKDWWALASTIVLFAVWALRFSLKKIAAFKKFVLESDVGGPLFTFVVAFLVAISTPLADGSPSLETLKVAAISAVMAIGGWHGVVKRFLLPAAKKAVGLVK